MTFDGILRGSLMEDNFQFKTRFDERQPSIDEDHQLKITFDVGQPLMEDKTTGHIYPTKQKKLRRTKTLFM